jgi:hypothetical protein
LLPIERLEGALPTTLGSFSALVTEARAVESSPQGADETVTSTARARSRDRNQLIGFDQDGLVKAHQGLDFSVERDTTNALDAVDGSASDNAEDKFRVAGASEGLSDQRETSAYVRQKTFANALGLREVS